MTDTIDGQPVSAYGIGYSDGLEGRPYWPDRFDPAVASVAVELYDAGYKSGLALRVAQEKSGPPVPE